MGTTGQSITLANSIIGVGILAMPFCFQQCGVLLATLILLFMGLISRLCCYFLLKSALLARRRNFEFLAFHVFGSAGKIAVEMGIIGFLMGTCIAYFVVVGDLGPQIIAKMFNINQSDILRTSIMVLVSLVCVLPLGLLRNVDSLSNVSAATIGFYFCLVIKVIVEAASVLLTWEWGGQGWGARVELWRPAGLLQCVPIFSMALFCQTQLFEIFESLPTLSLEKMNVVTKNAINICTGVYFTLGLFGYIAFCNQDISGNILMSLSPTMWNDVIKLGFVMSLAFSFPLIIFPCRASLYSFLYKKVHSSHHDHIINHSIPEPTFRAITVGIIAGALFVSLLLPNIELVLGLVGATIGVLICVVFPAACFVNVTHKNTNERLLAKGVLVLGLIIMVLGTLANLQAAGGGRQERRDDTYSPDYIDKIVRDFFQKQDNNDVYLKPDKSESLPIESLGINKDIIKDSEVQPPNPVPPESQSNEKIPEPKLEEPKLEEKKMVPLPLFKDALDKVSDTHPKNLKTKLEAKLNGISKSDPDKLKDTKAQSSEDKIDIMKQQKLIETIKQHGEEQKELMKEQKEILDEIIKTKKELEQNKNEAESNEAKKIAVESIKQIANIAIQSIGGVTEKPDQVNDNKVVQEVVQEIAKKAVEAIQEIKETPEQVNAVKDEQNKIPPQPIAANSIQGNENVQSQAQNVQAPVNPQNVQPKLIHQNLQQHINLPETQQNIHNGQNAQPPSDSQNVPPANSQNGQSAMNSQNVQPANSQNAQQVTNSQNGQPVINSQNTQPENSPLNAQQQNIKRDVNPSNNQPQVPQNIPAQPINAQQPQPANNPPIINTNNVPNIVASKIIPAANMKQTNQPYVPKVNNEAKAVNEAQIPKVQNLDVQQPAQNQNEVKQHSHSPDEPQSYKQGEDTQVKLPENKIPHNVPLAVAMNDLLSSKQIQEKEAVAEQMNEDMKINIPQKVPENKLNAQPNVVRQKREVVDCTQKVTLEPEDKKICDRLVDRPKDLDVIPPVDMNEIALPKDLPMDANVLHYIGRSLKIYDKDKR